MIGKKNVRGIEHSKIYCRSAKAGSRSSGQVPVLLEVIYMLVGNQVKISFLAPKIQLAAGHFSRRTGDDADNPLYDIKEFPIFGVFEPGPTCF